MKVSCILILLTSCVTVKNPPSADKPSTDKPQVAKITLACKRPILDIDKSTSWTPDDEKLIPGLHVRCKQLYSKNHCALKINKYKDLSYGITCKLQE